MTEINNPTVQVTNPTNASSPSGRLRVTIVKAENIRQGDVRWWSHKFYVAAMYNGIQEKTTLAKAGASSAVWNETLEFDINGSALELTIMKDQRTKEDKVIGVLTLTDKLLRALATGAEALCECAIPATILQQTTPAPNPLLALKVTYLTALVAISPPQSPEDLASSLAITNMSNASNILGQLQTVSQTVVDTISAAPEAAEAVTDFAHTWDPVLQKLEWIVGVVDEIAEIHPYAKIVWSVVSIIPKAIINQALQDASIQSLMESMQDALSFGLEAKELLILCQTPGQSKKLISLFEQISECSTFIRNYASDQKFYSRIIKYLASRGGIEQAVTDYCANLIALQEAFLHSVTLFTQASVTRLLCNMEDQEHDFLQNLPYAEGARFDEDKGCLHGTCTGILAQITTWALDPAAKPLFVLFGQAGRGKSAIAHSVAQYFDSMGQLCTSFMFKRGDSVKREAWRLFPTIAKDLSHRNTAYASKLCSAMRADTSSWKGAQNYKTLFDFLLRTPLQGTVLQGLTFIVIDALDECPDAASLNGLHTFLATQLGDSSLAFRVLITARPEPQIQESFGKCDYAQTESLDSWDSQQDIQMYLQHHLSLFTVDEVIRQLAIESEGLFQWASAAVSFILQPSLGGSPKQAAQLLIQSANPGTQKTTLSTLYTAILSNLPLGSGSLHAFHITMELVLLVVKPLSQTVLQYICSHAYPETSTVLVNVLKYMGSLLSNVHQPDNPVAPLHTSFHDYLLDPAQSGQFCISSIHGHGALLNASLSIMAQELKFNMCPLTNSHVLNKKVAGLEEEIKKNVSSHLIYASQFWSTHIVLSASRNSLSELLHLMENKFLFWLEVLSLTSSISMGFEALVKVQKWITGHGDKNRVVEQAIAEWVQFIRYFGVPISESVPHIYISALPFAPEKSWITLHHGKSYTRVAKVSKGKLDRWPGVQTVMGMQSAVVCVAVSPTESRIAVGLKSGVIKICDLVTGYDVLALEGHSDWVTSVAYSPDGKSVVSGSDDHTVQVWDIASQAMVAGPFEGHSGGVTSVAYSPDGKSVVSGSYDHTVRVWDIDLGTMISSSLYPPPFPPLVSNMSSDGWLLSPDGQLILWIPPIHRDGFYSPCNVAVFCRHATQVDFTEYVHGLEWSQCKTLE